MHLAIEIPTALHARFKAVSIGRQTTMRDAILAFLKAEVAEPDPQLTELLQVRVARAFKQDLLESARQQHITLTDLLVEAFGLLERRRDPVDMAVTEGFGRMRGGRREPHPAGQRVRENRLRGGGPSAE